MEIRVINKEIKIEGIWEREDFKISRAIFKITSLISGKYFSIKGISKPRFGEDFNVEFIVEGLDINLDLNEVYQIAFLNSEDFIENLRINNFPEIDVKKLIDITEKLYREYALSLNELKYLYQKISELKTKSWFLVSSSNNFFF